MGRKIPAKKHRGVKDPLEQQARRLQSLKTKINAPPKDPDEQPVPRSLTRLFAFSGHAANKMMNDKKKMKNTRHGSHRTDDRNISGVGRNPVNQLRKLPGETGRSFSLRINSAVRALHTNDEQIDYPQDMEEEEDKKGMRMAAQRERRARKTRRELAGPARQRRGELLLQAKKIRDAEAQAAARERHVPRVPFGAPPAPPPALPAPRRAPPADGAARPGRRQLLLSGLLPAAAAAGPQRLERAREDAVAAYRSLKAAKVQNKSTRRPPIIL